MDKLLLWLLLILPGALCDLPDTFSVNSYNLRLRVSNDVTAAVNGSVDISLTCKASTNNIVLHWGSSLTPTAASASPNLTITYTSADGSTVTPVKIVKTTAIAPDQISVTTETTLTEKGIVGVSATFQTGINDDKKGLFFRQYPIGNNQNNSVLLSNLWPTFARELFPCLDEPKYFANLTLTLIYPNLWQTAATTPGSSTGPWNNGTTTTVFTANDIPPSNFAFFLAANMNQKYTVARSRTQLQFFGRSGLPSSSFYSSASFLADYYYSVEELLGINLPTEQLTVVMVPGLEEPYAGYGVIFIREDNYARDYSSPLLEGLFKTNVAPVIYQFLRQFSEFSTRPYSWSDYWVSQAVSKYLQYLILNNVLPLLDFKTDLEVLARQTALSLDSQHDAKPLYDTFNDTNSTASVLALVNDPLKSVKGATILNMLEQSLPAGAVFAAIKTFLAANQGMAVTGRQFIQAIQKIEDNIFLSESAKESLTSTLEYWFSTTAYPLEKVKIDKYTSQDSSGVVNFTTTAFCSALNPSCKPDLPGPYYLSATVGSKTDNRYYTPRQDFWVNNVPANNTVNTTIDVQANDWVVANMKSGGYYRSNYTADNWERIISALASGDQSLLGRTQLLDDAFALALSSSDALNYNITLRLAIANLGNTPGQYKDWVPVQRGLMSIKNNLLGLDIYTSYKNFASGYYLNLNQFLQNRSTDAFEKARIQALFLDDMCENNVADYRASALGNLSDLLLGMPPKTIPSSTYDAMACCGARYGSKLEAQTLWKMLSDSTFNYYSRRYASIALGCLSNYTDIAQLFNTMTVANIQLKPYIQIALENVADKNPVQFLANFTTLVDKFQSKLGAASVASLITRLGRKINNNTYTAALDLDNNPNIDPLVKTVAKNTKDAISYRVNWLANNNSTLVSALQSHTRSTSSAISLTATCLLIFLPFLLRFTSAGV